MLLRFFFCPFLLFCLLACGNETANDRTAKTDRGTDTLATKRIRDLEPSLFAADSVQVLFYDDPDGDSLRYSRFFMHTEIADTAHIRSLLNELNQVYVQEPVARACRSEGKLYLLRGEDILKTVYFANRGDSCRYFYLIKDGAFFYFPQTDAAASWLSKQRKAAQKP